MKACIISQNDVFVEKLKDKIFSIVNEDDIQFNTVSSIKQINMKEIAAFGYYVFFIDTSLQENVIEFVNRLTAGCPFTKVVYFGDRLDNVYKLYATDHVAFINVQDMQPYINKAMESLKKYEIEFESNTIEIHWKNAVYVLQAKDILYIERDKRRTLVYTVSNEIYTTYQHLEEFIEPLGSGFLRVHFSYLINMKYVSEYHRSHLVLGNEVFIPISRKFSKDVKEIFSNMGNVN